MAAPAVKKSNSRVLSLPAKVYLILYNAIQFLGWSTILYKAVVFVATEKDFDAKRLWDHVQLPLLIFQTGAVFEIVHSAVGITPSGVGVTFVQVFSRVFLIWPILYKVPESVNQLGFPLMLTAWTVTEVQRYLYYVLNLINLVPDILQWCRYTFFIVLYPIGITGELICCYNALPYYDTTLSLSVSLPNAWNFAFSFYYYIVLVMLSYIPVFPQLYLHMFAQRKKIIGPKKRD